MRWTFRGMGPLAAAGASIGLLVVAGCAPSEGAGTPDPEDAVRTVNVAVQLIEPRGFTDFVRITGEVEALYDVTLSAEESGPVARFLVEKGASVSAGQVLAELDAAVLEAQVAEARATADLAREQHERQRRLWEDEHIGSEIAYLQTRSAAAAAAARLATLEARLGRTSIRAPVAGVFDEQFIEMGEMAAPGTPVARIVAVRRVKVTGGVPERVAGAVHAGDQAEVWFDVLPGERFTGRITFVGTSVDARNRTVPIEIVMTNPRGLAKPRMIANVQVVRERFDSVVVVPQQVVQRTEDGYQVFVAVDRGGQTYAEARPVVLGPAYRNEVVLRSGVVAGDRVITLGAQLVDADSRLRIVDVERAVPDVRKDSE